MHSEGRSRKQAEPPWISFADGLSALLFVFMLTTVWAMGKMMKEEEQNKVDTERLNGAKKEAEARLGMLQACISDFDKNFEVYPDNEDLSLAIIVPRLWFDPCSTDISAEGIRAVEAMRDCVDSKVLQGVFLDDVKRKLTDNYDIQVIFEGHTDATRIGKGCNFPSNWELSGARAAAVLRRFRCDEETECGEKERTKADEIKRAINTIGESHIRFLAVGMADTRPTWSAICESIGDWSCPDWGGKLPAGQALVKWANADGERRALLRRVDLRVDFRPRVPEKTGEPQ